MDEYANLLMREPLTGLSGGVAALCEALGRRLAADRITLWDLHGGSRRPGCLHQWSRPGCEEPGTVLPAHELPWLRKEVEAGRRVTFRSCALLPREAFRERKYFARHGPRSGALLPVMVGDVPVALLVVGTMRRERSWTAATVGALERAAVVLASALVRQRAHDASLETEGRLGGVLEAGPYGFMLVRPSGRVEFANGRAAALFLRTREELQGERLQELLVPSTEAGRRSGRGTLDVLLASSEPLRMQARRGDGSITEVEVTLREVQVPGERLLCCGVADVSEDRQAREDAVRIRDEIALRGRTAMLGELGSGIAHELNQPLTAILSNAEAAQRILRAPGGGDVADLRETLQDVVNETRRAAEILGRMREMLQRRHGERLPVDVSRVLEDVAQRFREEAAARGMRLAVEVAPGLPRVHADSIQLEQVVTNLVLNALEAAGASPGSQRTVAIRARPARPGGVDVSVRDSGPGLDDDALAHAFDPFFTTKAAGLGVGLPISRSIVEAHGGRLLARNNADGGATFEFNIPEAPHGASTGRRKPA